MPFRAVLIRILTTISPMSLKLFFYYPQLLHIFIGGTIAMTIPVPCMLDFVHPYRCS